MKQEEFFSSRWTLIISTPGIAAGTGNIWRFSRIVVQNGRGSFLIPCLVFLFTWSVPLITTEFAIGKNARSGPIGTFIKKAGTKCAWMNAFVIPVSAAIMCYHSVITGRCIRYLISAFSGNHLKTTDFTIFWNSFSSGNLPILLQIIAIFISVVIVYNGLVKGIEKPAGYFYCIK